MAYREYSERLETLEDPEGQTGKCRRRNWTGVVGEVRHTMPAAHTGHGNGPDGEDPSRRFVVKRLTGDVNSFLRPPTRWTSAKDHSGSKGPRLGRRTLVNLYH